MAVGDQGNVWRLFENQTVNGTSIEATLVNQTGNNYINVIGTLNGTVTFETNASGSWIPITGGVISAQGQSVLAGSASSRAIRAVLSGAGPHNVTVEVTKQ